jgi:hypothetical protein
MWLSTDCFLPGTSAIWWLSEFTGAELRKQSCVLPRVSQGDNWLGQFQGADDVVETRRYDQLSLSHLRHDFLERARLTDS